jgi:ribokinase
VADLIVANEVELSALARLLGIGAEAAAEQGLLIAQRLEVDLVCTLGAAGALGVRSGALVRVAAPAVAALDSTGAGDTFVGYLAAGLLAGYDLERAMGRASIAAAISVTRAGAMASVPSKDEVDALLAAML